MLLDLKNPQRSLGCKLLTNDVTEDFCIGRSCRKCRAGSYPTVLVPLRLRNVLNPKKLKIRKNRFNIRLVKGLEVARLLHKKSITFTLSESDYAQGMDLSFRNGIKKFNQKIMRLYGAFPYCCIDHLQGDKQRVNRHYICYGVDWLSPKILDDAWHDFYGSKVTGLERVRNEKGLAFYLAKYMGKDEKFVKARFSESWIFPKWWQFTRQYHKNFNFYPETETLARLSVMSQSDRSNEIEWLLRTGYGSDYYSLPESPLLKAIKASGGVVYGVSSKNSLR
jgi:hypothetical protein